MTLYGARETQIKAWRPDIGTVKAVIAFAIETKRLDEEG